MFTYPVWGGAAAEYSVVFEDTFTDTNGTDIQNHTPDYDPLGSGWTSVKNAAYPDLEIQSNAVVNQSANSSPAYCLADSGSWNDLLVNVTLIQSSLTYAFPKFVWRVQETVFNGSSDYYFGLVINPHSGNNKVDLYKRINAIDYLLDSVTVASSLLNSEIAFTLEDDGSDITVSFSHGGADYSLSATDTQLSDETQFGIASSRNTLCGATYIKVSTK